MKSEMSIQWRKSTKTKGYSLERLLQLVNAKQAGSRNKMKGYKALISVIQK